MGAIRRYVAIESVCHASVKRIRSVKSHVIRIGIGNLVQFGRLHVHCQDHVVDIEHHKRDVLCPGDKMLITLIVKDLVGGAAVPSEGILVEVRMLRRADASVVMQTHVDRVETVGVRGGYTVHAARECLSHSERGLPLAEIPEWVAGDLGSDVDRWCG